MVRSCADRQAAELARGAAHDFAAATEHCPYGFSSGHSGRDVIDMTGSSDRRGVIATDNDVRDYDEPNPHPRMVIDYDDGEYRIVSSFGAAPEVPFGECAAAGVLFDLGIEGAWSEWPGTCPVCGAENDCSDEVNGGDN